MKELPGHYHDERTGEHLGCIWTVYSATSRKREWHCEDKAGEKHPGPLPDRRACELWLAWRAQTRGRR